MVRLLQHEETADAQFCSNRTGLPSTRHIWDLLKLLHPVSPSAAVNQSYCNQLEDISRCVV
jgi:hypothetical protein